MLGENEMENKILVKFEALLDGNNMPLWVKTFERTQSPSDRVYTREIVLGEKFWNAEDNTTLIKGLCWVKENNPEEVRIIIILKNKSWFSG